jgi:hypothetical protein
MPQSLHARAETFGKNYRHRRGAQRRTFGDSTRRSNFATSSKMSPHQTNVIKKNIHKDRLWPQKMLKGALPPFGETDNGVGKENDSSRVDQEGPQ